MKKNTKLARFPCGGILASGWKARARAATHDVVDGVTGFKFGRQVAYLREQQRTSGRCAAIHASSSRGRYLISTDDPLPFQGGGRWHENRPFGNEHYIY